MLLDSLPSIAVSHGAVPSCHLRYDLWAKLKPADGLPTYRATRVTDYWRPETLDDLRSFIDNGLARETRWIEFKRQFPENPALAKQLAGFAIEGGALVVGVAEEQDNRFAVTPIPLAGLRERVEQVAQSLVDPPLWIESRALTDHDGENGALWIDVPPSLEAPHQVGGTYYERGDSQTRPMSDAAVERLMRERSASPDDIGEYLAEALRENPRFPWIGRTCIVARPVGAAGQELYDSTGGQAGWPQFAAEVTRARSQVHQDTALYGSFVEHGKLRLAQEYSDTIMSGLRRVQLLQSSTGNWGALENTGHRGGWRAPRARDYARLTLSDDGSLHYVTYCEFPGMQCIQPGLVVAACLDAVAAILLVGTKTTRRRNWDLGVGVTEAKNIEALPVFPEHPFIPGVRFRADTYTRLQRVSGQRLREDPWGIARDLTQRFVEGCGLDFQDEARALGRYEPTPSTHAASSSSD